MVVGEFNNVMLVEEMEGGSTPLVQEMQPFVHCVQECGLLDMRGRGRYFTWSKNTIRSKIDKVLIKEEWVEMYPEVEVFYTAECLSDHTRSLLSLSQHTRKRMHLFHYCNM